MEKMKMWKWGFFVLMAFSFTLTVACGGDKELASEPTESRVFPTYIFSEGSIGLKVMLRQISPNLEEVLITIAIL